MDHALAPPEAAWHPVSEQLFRVRRFVLLVVAVPLGVAGAVVGGIFVGTWLAGLIGGLLAVVLVWAVVALRRNQRSWRYAERADDLLIAHGVMWRRLVVVPYGRMQFVDVTAGPVERRFGIAKIKLHTASAATDAVVRGLPPEEAARLRDRLAERGEARSAGL
ncbi:PH domain-containing protein [Yinghuangia seranimata]|uniref:PH domain-containing protein n=1 Tax=Yinghuangia seranimata TaxID=408067 RepID=UPI00248BE059|nr:PH domain-containing protein [Yinghuangia seranimata]MDI2127997.1 PH domain-containing protein [Yinghuangia seranimata]